MCEDASTFTERAASWIKEFEPSPDQLQDAYTKMLSKLAKEPELANADTEACLELLIACYGKSGGSVDDLLSAIDAGKPGQAGVAAGGDCIEGDLDYGVLYEVSDEPRVALDPSEKRAEFLRLKAQLQSNRTAA